MTDWAELSTQLYRRIESLEERVTELESGRIAADLGKDLRTGELFISPARYIVTWRGKHVTCTAGEMKMMAFLASRPGYIRTRDALLDLIDDGILEDRSIDARIKRIRRRFRAVDPKFDQIETVYGMGYRWRA